MSTESAMQQRQTLVEFWVPGNPQTQGSKRSFPIKRKNGTVGVAVSDDNPKGVAWKGHVADTAAEAMQGADLLRGALQLHLTFHVLRPKGHFGTGRNAGKLKPSAPKYPATRPDVLKLTRAVEDAMTGVVWKDDAQVVIQKQEKTYSDCTGVKVLVFQLD